MSIAKVEHHVAHHYKDADHEYNSAKLGVWLFLATEILMFGGLFVAYFYYHSKYPSVFAEGSKMLDWRLGAANTIILLFSSLTMALGIHFLQKGRPDKAKLNLFITILCGFGFMMIKYIEYSHKIHMGTTPGATFHYTDGHNWNLALYFSFYFMMTGLHGIHVVAGMGLITWVLIRTQRGDFGPNYFTAVEGVGLFWHLVDLIWIYLFPMFYLVG